MNTLQQIDALLDHRLDVGIIRKRALPRSWWRTACSSIRWR
jgi:hypothetical protein